MRTIRKKNVCHCKPERLWWRHVRNTQRTLKYLTMIWAGKREQHLYQYTGIIFCALIQGSVQFRGSWTGHLAAENLTFDPVVESPSVLYISEHATESIQKRQRQTFFFITFNDNYVTKCTCTFKSVEFTSLLQWLVPVFFFSCSHFFGICVTVDYKELS